MIQAFRRMPDGSVDCGVIGGGVIGLSIARELAGRGLSVAVVPGGPRKESSSWAAAGILPPAPMPSDAAAEPNEALTAVSDRLHRDWSVALREETGIDNGLRRCGGLHLAGDEGDLGRLAQTSRDWRRRGARAELLSAADVAAAEPAFKAAVTGGRILGGMLLPDETQIHSARHLEAVAASCRLRGVTILAGEEMLSFTTSTDRVESVETSAGTLSAANWVLAAGAHSEKFASAFGLALSTRPIRGQIVVMNPGRAIVNRIVNRGLDYMLQREDGGLLVGSTIEDAGFDRRTTPEAIARLVSFARDLAPALEHAPVERAWAGLRPGSADGLPTIGRLPGFGNAFIAAGHFRAGVHQSTGTAVIVADLVTGRVPSLRYEAFAADRRIDRSAIGGIEDCLARVECDSAGA